MQYVYAERRDQVETYASKNDLIGCKYLGFDPWLFGIYEEKVTVLKSAMNLSDYEQTIANLKTRRCVIVYEE